MQQNDLLFWTKYNRNDARDAHLRLIAAAPALVGVCAGVGDGHEAAQVADVDLVRVRCLKKPFFQELSSTVRNLTITFHLSKSQPTIAT